MLNTALLLDSARPFSDDRKITYGCPEHSSEGVPLSCHKGTPIPALDWYVLRVSYSRELKIKALLDDKGVETFIPMIWRKKAIGGKTVKQLVPAVSNLCFVRWTKDEIVSFISGYGEKSPVHFYWDRTTSRPLTVPEKAMKDFMTVASTMDEDLIYLTEISDKLREGQTVKVKSGPFAGITGRIVRIRKSRRIMVELPGMLAVASTYVKPEEIEIEID